LGEVLGKRIKHVDLPHRDFEDRMQAYGMPEDYAKVMARLDRSISLNAEHRVNDVVESLLGRRPKHFRETAEEVKAVWQ
jgi:hypothetical protein